jgi:predicted DNA-binding transcriptional regulator YafY
MPLYVSSWGAGAPARVDFRLLRRAIRDETKLRIAYEDIDARRTRRVIKPLGLLYYVEVVVLTAWCELRQAFRHFRVDRIVACKVTSQKFSGEGDRLRALWREQHKLP